MKTPLFLLDPYYSMNKFLYFNYSLGTAVKLRLMLMCFIFFVIFICSLTLNFDQ
uniref:Uncharacterized protein n=1 Tax=Anguilla anguilla TaxID=7936 RepID=A0A0E9QT15_ANGAN